jgi:putative transcriptional regulator
MISIILNMTSILDIFISMYYPDFRQWPMKKFTLRNRMKVARAEKALSQEELAKLAGVTRQTISSIETGEYCPSALLAFLLARRLDKKVEDLFFLEGDDL